MVQFTILNESWGENNDNTKHILNSHTCYFKKAKHGRAVCCTSIYRRNEIVKYITRIEENCCIGIVFKVEKSFVNFNEYLYLLFIYLPPTNSPPYADKQAKGIFLLEDVRLSIYTKHNATNSIIMGDINARCGDLNEYAETEHDLPVLEQYKDVYQCP